MFLSFKWWIFGLKTKLTGKRVDIFIKLIIKKTIKEKIFLTHTFDCISLEPFKFKKGFFFEDFQIFFF